MAIRHTIRSSDGGTKEVKLTPIHAIRYFCLECVCWSFEEVEHCTSPLCPLYPFRFGKNPSRKGIGRQGGNPNLKRKPI